jgi:hypothetical protein
MPPTTPVLLAAAVLLGALTPLRARAQASPYIPVDDPRLPLLEHLIARGDVADPTPMVRPFRRADAVRALEAADTGGPSASLIRALRTELDDGPATQRWQASGRAGGQVYSHVRRDVLHPLGPDGVRPFADLAAEVVFDQFVLRTRPTAEPRLTDDPEWPGRRDLELIWRFPEAYLAAQFGGLGRNFADQDQVTVQVSMPLGVRWLVTPELTLLRQGEGDLDDPFPVETEAGPHLSSSSARWSAPGVRRWG